MCHFLSHKNSIESKLKSQNKALSFIWFYDPLKNAIEWMSLKEIVDSLVTDKHDELLDPQRIICGCGIVLDHAWSPKMGPESSIKPEAITVLPPASTAQRSAAFAAGMNFNSRQNLVKNSYLNDTSASNQISKIFGRHRKENYTNSKSTLKNKFSSRNRKEGKSSGNYRGKESRRKQDVIRIRLTDGPLFISKPNQKPSRSQNIKKFKTVQTQPSNRRRKKSLLENINFIKYKMNPNKSRMDSSRKNQNVRNASMNNSAKSKRNPKVPIRNRNYSRNKNKSKYIKSKSTRRKRSRNCNSLMQSSRMRSLKGSNTVNEDQHFQISQALQIKKHNPLFRKISRVLLENAFKKYGKIGANKAKSVDKYRGNGGLKKTVFPNETGFEMVPYIRQNDLLHNFARNFARFLIF